MNLNRPVQTLEDRIDKLDVWIRENPRSLVKWSDDAITDMRNEIEEHKRAIEFLKQIVHIST